MGRKNCGGVVFLRFFVFVGGEGMGVKEFLDDV